MNIRLTTHTTYPQMRTETLITMVCFSTHADVRLDMYKQKSCATVMIGSVVHAPHYSSRKISSMRSRYLLSSMAGDPSRLWRVSARRSPRERERPPSTLFVKLVARVRTGRAVFRHLRVSSLAVTACGSLHDPWPCSTHPQSAWARPAALPSAS